MSNVGDGFSQYDAFGESFSRSRKGMGWDEIRTFCETLGKTVSKPNVLDVGSGSGRLIGQLSETFADFRYLGADSSRVLVSVAKKEFPEREFLLADMRDVANVAAIQSSAPFDALFAVASFHHLLTVEDRRKTLDGFARLLSPSGSLFMTNWNLLSESNMAKYGERRREDGVFEILFSGKPRTYYAFTEAVLRKEFELAGWEISEFSQNERNLATVAKFRGFS